MSDVMDIRGIDSEMEQRITDRLRYRGVPALSIVNRGQAMTTNLTRIARAKFYSKQCARLVELIEEKI